MIFTRILEKTIQKVLHQPHPPAIILYGPRRVGKTTLVKALMDKTNIATRLFPCDDPATATLFKNTPLAALKSLLKPYRFIVLDEAQLIPDVGITLKLITDYLPEIKMVVTGSSSLNLANSVSEPLTGRKQSFFLYPLAVSELFPQPHPAEITPLLEQFLRFGFYPQVHTLNSDDEKSRYLSELTTDYLYRDALHFLGEQNLESVKKLLIALALQIGQEVSYTELAKTVGMNHKTIIKYITILEQSFVIIRLTSLSRNLRTELNKTRKIYFYDVGIRNALTNNFNPTILRADKGGLWENFLVIERMKRNAYAQKLKNYYFWRSYAGKEVDFIEEAGGVLDAVEFKWTDSKFTSHQRFFQSIYPDSRLTLINQDNWLNWVTL